MLDKPFIKKKVPFDYFKKSTMQPLTLPLEGKIGKGELILSGTAKITGGTTSGTVKGEGGPVNLIKKIIVRANPADGSRYKGGEVVDATPRSLLHHAVTQDRKYFTEQSGSTLGDGDAGTYPIYLCIPIFWADPNIFRQWDTALNADPYAFKSIQVEVYTGDLSDCFDGNDRTLDVSGLSLRWRDERKNFPGDTLELIQKEHTTQIPASKKDFVDKGFPSDGAFLTWLLMTETTAASTLTDSILNNLKINSAQRDFDFEDQDIRQDMVNDNWYDAAVTMTGQYFIDLIDGNLNDAVVAAGLTHELDITMLGDANTDVLRWFTRRVFAPAGYAGVGSVMTPMKEYTKK